MILCPPRQEWLRLVDGQLVEERAGELRAHAAGCPQCAPRLASSEQLVRRIAAPVPEVVTDGARERILQRLAPQPARPIAAGGFGWSKWLALGGLVSAAATVALLVHPTKPPEFMPRGSSAEHSLAREVGVSLFTGDGAPRRLAPRQAIGRETPLVTTARNLSAQPAWLLAVAVDAAGRVHWIQPGPEAPEAISLRPHALDAPLPETVVLDDPAIGPMRVLTIVSATPLAPSALRNATAAELTPAALSRLFPGAVVDELPLTVTP